MINIFKKQKKKSKKTEQRELDNMWKQKVKDRDMWCCQFCHKKLEGRSCHAHHILPKRMKGMRWDIHNGITLCPSHHKLGIFSAHNNALWFTYWLKTNRPDQFKYLVNKLVERGK